MGKDIHGNDCGKGISQRADGRYYVRIKGIPPAYRDTLRDAQAYRDDQLYRQRNGLPLMSGRRQEKAEITVDEYFFRWITDEYDCGNIRRNTYRARANYYTSGIQPVIGRKLLSAVSRDDCRKVMKYLNAATSKRGRPYKHNTKRAIYGTLVLLMDAAADQEIIPKSPVPRKQRFVDQSAEQRGDDPVWKRALTNQELSRLFVQLRKSSYRLLAMLAWVTGMRAGELAALRYTDIDLVHGVIHVRRNAQYGRMAEERSSWLIEPPKTDAGERDVPIWADCRRVLDEIFALRPYAPHPANPAYADLVFLTRNGRPMQASNVYTALSLASERAGIERVTMHTFRHTFVTNCRRAGMEELIIQRIVGHVEGSDVTANTYTHLSIEDCREALGKLNSNVSENTVLSQILSQDIVTAA